MANALLSNPTYQLQPSAEQVALQTNYITNFNFLNQYLPDTYEKEFERYGNRTIAPYHLPSGIFFEILNKSHGYYFRQRIIRGIRESGLVYIDRTGPLFHIRDVN